MQTWGRRKVLSRFSPATEAATEKSSFNLRYDVCECAVGIVSE
jgi:hypothetical protein